MMNHKLSLIVLFSTLCLFGCVKEHQPTTSQTPQIENISSNQIENTSVAPQEQLTEVQQDYGTETRQGLKFVNDAVIAHLDKYNKQHGTQWESLEPDARISTTKCIVPLRTKWADFEQGYPMRYDENSWFVKVYCDKALTTSANPKGKGWDILVPTTRPK